MPRKKSKAQKHEYSFLTINITGYKAAISAAINYEICDPRRCHGDEKVYRFDTRLEIEGCCTYPEEREGGEYAITIHGSECCAGQFAATLKDCRVIGDDRLPMYTKVRGKDVPVYDVPKDIGMLDRQRGTRNWNGWLWVSPRTVSDMLALLPHIRPLYLGIHELREGRNHWIHGLTLAARQGERSGGG